MVRTRFAPSPTGYLHIGGLRTALYGYLFAKKQGGKFVLRLEDTDTERYVADSVQLIYDSLKVAGIYYDEGPDVGGEFGPYVQSERKGLYLEYAKKLIERGGAYYCFCDKERTDSLVDENGNKRYDKHCLNLSKEEIKAKLESGVPYVIRQNVPLTGEGSYNDLVYGEITVKYEDIEDGILIKSDGMPTYNFANVVDDHLMGITHVIRGTEYLSSTPKYNLLYDGFGWERPVYIHLPPIMKNQKEKLSKRNGDASFQDFIDKGYIKEAVINYIALLGWSPKDNREKMTLSELTESFSLEGINKSPSIFDDVKCRWLSGEYIKAMDFDTLYDLALPYFEKSSVAGKYDYKKILKLLHSRIEILSEIPEKVAFLGEMPSGYDLAIYEHKKMKCDKDIAKAVLPIAREALLGLDEFTNDNLFALLSSVAEANGYKKTQILWAVRVALSGLLSTPGGATELAEILGKEESVKRIDIAIAYLG